MAYEARVSRRGESTLEAARSLLFLATGLAVPLYVFPLFHIFGKLVDPATFLAALFVAASLFSPRIRGASRASRLFAVLAITVPLLVLIPPWPRYFVASQFFLSYAHWLIVSAFFFCALQLERRPWDERRLVAASVAAGVLIALFALYQVLAIPRGWPASGTRLGDFQREGFRFMPLGNYVRPTSIFVEPGFLGGYLAWCLALSIGAFLAARTLIARLSLTLASMAMFAGVVATISFGAYADLLILFAVAAVVVARLGRKEQWLLAGLVAVLFLGALVPVAVSGRLRKALSLRYHNVLSTGEALKVPVSDLEDSTWVRIRNLELTAEQLRSRPLRGIGLGQFPFFEPARPLGRRGYAHFGRDPGSGWLAIAAEMGLIGLGLLALAVSAPLARWRHEPRESLAGIAVPCIVTVAAVMQVHTATFIDLWWWYPVALAALLAAPVFRVPAATAG